MGAKHTTLKLAGMAADLYGTPDRRYPLVLLPGLTFDGGIWQPANDDLAGIDPYRQVLVLDLPVHATRRTSYHTRCSGSSG